MKPTQSNPLVTVLMPVYNGGEYLKLSIGSILLQTYKDFELLIINDCSTDNSMEVIQSFNDSRIVVHSNPVNMGQTKSLNAGLRLAKGRYIVVNDADDLSLPQRIEKQLDFITKHPEYPVVGCSAYIMNKNGRISRIFQKAIDQRTIQICPLSEPPLIHGSVIMNREVILGEGGYNESFRICQDYEMWSLLMRKGFHVTNLPDILVGIRHYAESLSFRESEAQTIENGRTIQANVEAFTNLTITLDEAVRQRLFLAAPERLSEEEFSKAERLFVQQYRNHREQIFLKTDLKKRLFKTYAKLALDAARNGRHKESRKIAYCYLVNYGFQPIAMMIFVSSFFGKKALLSLWRIYIALQKIVTVRYRFKLRGKD